MDIELTTYLKQFIHNNERSLLKISFEIFQQRMFFLTTHICVLNIFLNILNMKFMNINNYLKKIYS